MGGITPSLQKKIDYSIKVIQKAETACPINE